MAEMKLTPRLPHFVWSANPLAGGNTSGPAKPVPRCSTIDERDVVWRGPREVRWSY
jgi:hypothetical protein